MCFLDASILSYLLVFLLMAAFHVCALRHVLLHGRDTDKIWCESRVTEVDVDGDPEKVKVLLWGLCNGGRGQGGRSEELRDRSESGRPTFHT